VFRVRLCGIDGVRRAARAAFLEMACGMHGDLVDSGLMPFEDGVLQNEDTFVDESRLGDGRVDIVSDTVYARRKYFEPGLEFDRSVNRQASGRWFEPYLEGERRGLWLEIFAREMKGRLRQ